MIRKQFAIGLFTFSIATTGYTASPSQSLGVGTNGVAFVPSRACANCHKGQYRQWQQSHHYHAMSEANDDTVLANFSNAEFTKDSVTSRFFKKNGKFYINTQGYDGKYRDFEVAYTFGYSPLQQYLLSMPDGRLQALTVAWDTQNNLWMSLYPDEQTPPGDPLHWGSRHFT